MAQSKFVIISEDPVLVQKAKDFASQCGIECEVRSPHAQGSGFYPSLISGSNPLRQNGLFPEGSNVLPFPSQGSKVSKMNDLEAQAIEQAIHAYRGNLTEAARALGIGRATLYRKVKLYNIDPANARRKKAA